MYVGYCQNKYISEHIVNENNKFFEELHMKLFPNHKLFVSIKFTGPSHVERTKKRKLNSSSKDEL